MTSFKTSSKPKQARSLQQEISFVYSARSGADSTHQGTSSTSSTSCCLSGSYREKSSKDSIPSKSSKAKQPTSGIPSKSSKAKNPSNESFSTSRRSKFIRKLSDEVLTENEDFSEDFTPTGSKPGQTVGDLNKGFDPLAKYAPYGHWKSCKSNDSDQKDSFNACKSCGNRAPYGPYGPWGKNGPAKFFTPKEDYLKQVYPMKRRKRNGLDYRLSQPMGKLRPWPLSGSCRYAGRPYGPCRPHGAYKSRGPFGVWTWKAWPECLRPLTPAQPCWMPKKSGRRPCTPCHRPLFRPCQPYPK